MDRRSEADGAGQHIWDKRAENSTNFLRRQAILTTLPAATAVRLWWQTSMILWPANANRLAGPDGSRTLNVGDHFDYWLPRSMTLRVMSGYDNAVCFDGAEASEPGYQGAAPSFHDIVDFLMAKTISETEIHGMRY